MGGKGLRHHTWKSFIDVADELGITKRQLSRLVKQHNVPVIDTKAGPQFDQIALSALTDSLRYVPDEEPRPPKLSYAPKAMLAANEIIALSRPRPKAVSGVYFLIRHNQIIYIGQAVNIPIRIAVHARRIMFDRYHSIECALSRLDAVERAYIRKFRPLLNRAHNQEVNELEDTQVALLGNGSQEAAP